MTEQYRIAEKTGYDLLRCDQVGDYVVLQVINHYYETEDEDEQHNSAVIKVPIKEFENIIFKLGLDLWWTVIHKLGL